MRGGQGSPGQSKDAAAIVGAVAKAVGAIHEAAAAAKPVAQPKQKRKAPPKPAIHDLVTARRPATPIVTEHTRGQAHGGAAMPAHGLPADLGVAPAPGLSPQDKRFYATRKPPALIPGVAKLGNTLLGNPVGGGVDLIKNPKAHLFPAGARPGASGTLPKVEPSLGVIPWGAPGELPGIGKLLSKIKGGGEAAVHVPSVPPEGAEQVKAALPGAKTVRGFQEAGYSAERSARAKAAEAAMRANPGMEGHINALHALRGELPKINFGGFKELNPEALNALAVHIQEHPHLLPYQKITAVQALANAADGKVPTNSEIKLLTNIFGKDTVSGLAKIHTLPDHIKNTIIEALNVPRSIMASFDLSAPFRQGLMAGARHPVMFARNFGPMIRSFAKEGAYQDVERNIQSRPTFHMMNAAKLAITDVEGDLSNREEQLFGYKMGERIPVVGHPIRASGRAYNAFLTKMRADMFDHLVKGFQAQGIDVQNEDFLKALGRYINASTGRGDLGYFQGAAPYLNTLFFSPRLLASRLNFLNPVFYARLPAPIRKEALRSALQLTGLVSTTLGLAAFGGAKVVRDPRNADFAKIRIGNTRMDVLGGFQQPIRLLSQLASGKIISSTTGDPLALGPQGPGSVSRRDILMRFFEGKLAPTPSVVNDWFKGTNFQGQKFSWKKETLQHMTPLLAQDAADLYNAHQGGMNGIAAAVGGYGLGAFGVGLQTYGPQDVRKKTTGKWEKQYSSLNLAPSVADQRVIGYQAVRANARHQQPNTIHGRYQADLNALVEIGIYTQAQADAKAKIANGLSDWVVQKNLSPALPQPWANTETMTAVRSAANRKAKGG